MRRDFNTVLVPRLSFVSEYRSCSPIAGVRAVSHTTSLLLRHIEPELGCRITVGEVVSPTSAITTATTLRCLMRWFATRTQTHLAIRACRSCLPLVTMVTLMLRRCRYQEPQRM